MVKINLFAPVVTIISHIHSKQVCVYSRIVFICMHTAYAQLHAVRLDIIQKAQ